MAVLVDAIIGNAKLILQEHSAEGRRWKNDELAGWLNEAYQAVAALKPDAVSVNEALTLAPGTKQSIPAGGIALIDVVRNLAGNMRPVRLTSRRALDTARPSWHSDPASLSIEQYVFDDLDQKTFYVYPAAATGAELEIIYSRAPDPHDISAGYSVYSLESFRLDDSLAPPATDYILYRAFSKDAEAGANLNRASMHYQAFVSQVTGKTQVDQITSPNSPDTSSNRPRGS